MERRGQNPMLRMDSIPAAQIFCLSKTVYSVSREATAVDLHKQLALPKLAPYVRNILKISLIFPRMRSECRKRARRSTTEVPQFEVNCGELGQEMQNCPAASWTVAANFLCARSASCLTSCEAPKWKSREVACFSARGVSNVTELWTVWRSVR
jgi:hypothetical protein